MMNSEAVDLKLALNASLDAGPYDQYSHRFWQPERFQNFKRLFRELQGELEPALWENTQSILGQQFEEPAQFAKQEAIKAAYIFLKKVWGYTPERAPDVSSIAHSNRAFEAWTVTFMQEVKSLSIDQLNVNELCNGLKAQMVSSLDLFAIFAMYKIEQPFKAMALFDFQIRMAQVLASVMQVWLTSRMQLISIPDLNYAHEKSARLSRQETGMATKSAESDNRTNDINNSESQRQLLCQIQIVYELLEYLYRYAVVEFTEDQSRKIAVFPMHMQLTAQIETLDKLYQDAKASAKQSHNAAPIYHNLKKQLECFLLENERFQKACYDLLEGAEDIKCTTRISVIKDVYAGQIQSFEDQPKLIAKIQYCWSHILISRLAYMLYTPRASQDVRNSYLIEVLPWLSELIKTIQEPMVLASLQAPLGWLVKVYDMAATQQLYDCANSLKKLPSRGNLLCDQYDVQNESQLQTIVTAAESPASRWFHPELAKCIVPLIQCEDSNVKIATALHTFIQHYVNYASYAVNGFLRPMFSIISDNLSSEASMQRFNLAQEAVQKDIRLFRNHERLKRLDKNSEPTVPFDPYFYHEFILNGFIFWFKLQLPLCFEDAPALSSFCHEIFYANKKETLQLTVDSLSSFDMSFEEKRLALVSCRGFEQYETSNDLPVLSIPLEWPENFGWNLQTLGGLGQSFSIKAPSKFGQCNLAIQHSLKLKQMLLQRLLDHESISITLLVPSAMCLVPESSETKEDLRASHWRLTIAESDDNAMKIKIGDIECMCPIQEILNYVNSERPPAIFCETHGFKFTLPNWLLISIFNSLVHQQKTYSCHAGQLYFCNQLLLTETNFSTAISRIPVTKNIFRDLVVMFQNAEYFGGHNERPISAALMVMQCIDQSQAGEIWPLSEESKNTLKQQFGFDDRQFKIILQGGLEHMRQCETPIPNDIKTTLSNMNFKVALASLRHKSCLWLFVAGCASLVGLVIALPFLILTAVVMLTVTAIVLGLWEVSAMRALLDKKSCQPSDQIKSVEQWMAEVYLPSCLKSKQKDSGVSGPRLH